LKTGQWWSIQNQPLNWLVTGLELCWQEAFWWWDSNSGGMFLRVISESEERANANRTQNAATAAGAVAGVNGSRANSIFEAVVLTDLDFIKLAAHPDYAPKEPVADGVPPKLAPPLHKNGEPSGCVISASLDAADKRVLKAAGRAAGELGNIVCIKVSDEEYAALSKHPAYDFEPREDRTDKRVLAVPAHLRGRLERRGQNIVLLSASLAADYNRRLATIRARTDEFLSGETRPR
jgi:hypothetical protein